MLARDWFGRAALPCLFVSAIPAVAHAGMCEDTFLKKGNPVTGLQFTAIVTVPDMSPASAIGQMQGIAITGGYDVLLAEAEDGSMLIEQPQTSKARAIPITITATDSGTVTMETELCKMLNQLKGGKAGLALAAKAKGAVSAQPPLALSALELSHQISKDTERNAAAIPLRYKNKRFTIDGFVDYVIKDGEFFRVAYKIMEPYEEAIRLPDAAKFKTDINCLMAKGQGVYALTLRPGKSIKLTGAFYDFDEFKHVMWLSNCRPGQ
jgi:hypothetical protein